MKGANRIYRQEFHGLTIITILFFMLVLFRLDKVALIGTANERIINISLGLVRGKARLSLSRLPVRMSH